MNPETLSSLSHDELKRLVAKVPGLRLTDEGQIHGRIRFPDGTVVNFTKKEIELL